MGTNRIKPDKKVSWISRMCVHSLCNRASPRHRSTFYGFYIASIKVADTHILCFRDSGFSLTLCPKQSVKWDEVRWKNNNRVPLVSAKLVFCFLSIQTLKSWKQSQSVMFLSRQSHTAYSHIQLAHMHRLPCNRTRLAGENSALFGFCLWKELAPGSTKGLCAVSFSSPGQ